jgi:class 3 adenylate cyclase
MTPPEEMVHAKIAIVMTDIIGSTKFVQKNGATSAALWFSKHDRLTMTLIAEHGGQFIDASDGMLCYFSSVGDAISFAFDYKKSLVAFKFPFRSRIGIHWDDMIITKTNQKLVLGGAKRMNIEGIGKNICARTMSLCGPDQILLSQKAHIAFKSRISSSRFIPKDVLIALVGLYKFKGVREPEVIYALGTQQSQLQPPVSSEKAVRIGGNKKIKTRLRQKKVKELIEYFFWRIGFLNLMFMFYLNWNLVKNEKPFSYIDVFMCYVITIINMIIQHWR